MNPQAQEFGEMVMKLHALNPDYAVDFISLAKQGSTEVVVPKRSEAKSPGPEVLKCMDWIEGYLTEKWTSNPQFMADALKANCTKTSTGKAKRFLRIQGIIEMRQVGSSKYEWRKMQPTPKSVVSCDDTPMEDVSPSDLRKELNNG